MNKKGTIVPPLLPSEIESWARLVGVALKPYEAAWLMQLDETYRTMAEKGQLSQATGGRVAMTDSKGLSAMLPGRRVVSKPKPNKKAGQKPIARS